MSNLSQSSQTFIEQNSAVEFSCSEPWLNQLRKNGLESFSVNGLPTPNVEEWKYTSLKVLDGIGDVNNNALDLDGVDLGWLPADLETHRLVFVNGRFDKDLSAIGQLGEGIKVLSLSEALSAEAALIKPYLGQISSVEDFPVLALNTAFIEDGLVVLIENVKLDKPIEVLYVSQGDGNATHHPRNLVVAKDGSHVTILERHVGIGNGNYLTNSVFEILVDGGSYVKHYRMLEDSAEGINLSSVNARVGKDGTYDSFILTVGSCLSRSEIHVACQAEGARTNLSGVYIARADQHMDHTTLIEHLVPNTTSSESYKGVLDDKARGVFQGSIIVSDGADGTDGRMSNKTLLLSDGAEIDAKPQLEIYADDVQCAHGFTAGELDGEALFYLRSRGIPDAMARSMLVEGFLMEVIDLGVDEDYQGVFRETISEWMDR
jgi:Fe-S cluster assembly protein SufD